MVTEVSTGGPLPDGREWAPGKKEGAKAFQEGRWKQLWSITRSSVWQPHEPQGCRPLDSQTKVAGSDGCAPGWGKASKGRKKREENGGKKEARGEEGWNAGKRNLHGLGSMEDSRFSFGLACSLLACFWIVPGFGTGSIFLLSSWLSRGSVFWV